MFSNRYNGVVHGPPGPLGPAVPIWLSENPPQQETGPELPLATTSASAVAVAEPEQSFHLDTPEAAPGEPWDADTVDPDEVPPCPTCGSLEQWESLAGVWHCLTCQPPHRSNLIQRKAARFRRLAEAAL